VEEIFRRAVFNVAAGNNDDHGRNHAFIMAPDGNWTTSPAYDLTFASHPLATNLRSASVMGRFAEVSRRDLVALGKSQGVRRIDDTIDRILEAICRWPEFATAAGIPSPHATAMEAEFPASEW
jgi:serine/threonine-protein kinase HipA